MIYYILKSFDCELHTYRMKNDGTLQYQTKHETFRDSGYPTIESWLAHVEGRELLFEGNEQEYDKEYNKYVMAMEMLK